MTVHFVGAGPGAADLLTLRGRDIIASCPVCLYAGSLVPEEILSHCPADAKVVNTAAMDLEAIVAEIKAAHEAGQDVVRLHSGDLSVWSAMGEQLRRLKAEGIPVSVLVAPVVPAINDHEIERLLDAAYAAGAREAGYVMLRLPNEVKELARDWLAEHFPGRAKHVLSLLKDMHGGKDYDSRWGVRQSGTGPIAWAIGRRFEMAAQRLGFNRARVRLRTDLFAAPDRAAPGQLALF